MNYGAFDVATILPTISNTFATVTIERELDNNYDTYL